MPHFGGVTAHVEKKKWTARCRPVAKNRSELNMRVYKLDAPGNG
jgi:hypothetical protein